MSIPIKLLNIGTVLSGVIRLQSQLYVGTITADFTLENGILHHYEHGEKGFDFYPVDIPYIIVSNKSEMYCQQL